MVGLDNPLHLAIILVVVLLLFGAKRLPEIGRSLGTGLRGFKESVSGDGAPAPAEERTVATIATPASETASDPASGAIRTEG